jgi:hypothetical protein
MKSDKHPSLPKQGIKTCPINAAKSGQNLNHFNSTGHLQQYRNEENFKSHLQYLPRLHHCLIPLTVESILISSSTSSSNRLSMISLSREVRLVVYALGIFFCYFFFGIFQEKM